MDTIIAGIATILSSIWFFWCIFGLVYESLKDDNKSKD